MGCCQVSVAIIAINGVLAIGEILPASDNREVLQTTHATEMQSQTVLDATCHTTVMFCLVLIVALPTVFSERILHDK